MKNIAFIPVRGGSKSIPLKNIKEICGKPLVYWTAKAACECRYIDEVYIATDSREIEAAVDDFKGKEPALFSKLRVVGRSAENASDTASTESVMLEFASQYQFENMILIQATSPLLTGADVDGGFELFESDGTDSVLSVVRQKRFLWARDEDGFVSPSNYDVFKRPRRQDFDGYLMENGAFYITSKADLLKSENRLSGNIKAYEMSEDTALEIDEPSDFLIIEALMRKRQEAGSSEAALDIKMIVTDCDGCLTDGGMYYSENGDELKKFNTKDGMALARAHAKGLITGIITGESRSLNKRRADKLKMDFIESGISCKDEALKTLCEQFGIGLENVLYIGDDLNDLPAMAIAGATACPADASCDVRKAADYIAEKRGGDGAVRDIIEHYGLM